MFKSFLTLLNNIVTFDTSKNLLATNTACNTPRVLTLIAQLTMFNSNVDNVSTVDNVDNVSTVDNVE